MLLPCYIATMAPVFAKRLKILKSLDRPIDFNIKIRKKPLFGRNKTIRGYVVGIIIAIITVYLQTIFYNPNISIIPYPEVNTLLLGFLFGFGALFGDSVESFIKRQINIAPGKPFIPFDDIDAVIGTLLFVSIINPFTTKIFIIAIILTFVLTVLTNLIGYLLGIKEVWW
jgi:CDP-2,3-bis-(O-geranylgeranyl)-sn-glycerol synthase